MPSLKDPLKEAFARRRAAAVAAPEHQAASLRAVLGITEPPPLRSKEDNAQRVRAAGLANHPLVVARVAELLARSERQTLVTLRGSDLEVNDAIAFLGQAVLTPVGDVDESSPLAQECTTHHDSRGNVTRRKIKTVDKLASLALLSKIKGWTSDAVVLLSFPGFERELHPSAVRVSTPLTTSASAPSPSQIPPSLPPHSHTTTNAANAANTHPHHSPTSETLPQ